MRHIHNVNQSITVFCSIEISVKPQSTSQVLVTLKFALQPFMLDFAHYRTSNWYLHRGSFDIQASVSM